MMLCGVFMSNVKDGELRRNLWELVENWRSDGKDLVEKTDSESLQSNGRARLGCADQVELLLEQ